MKNQHNFFIKTDDSENIFYSTNFKPGTVKENIIIFNYGLVCSNFHWGKQIEFFESLGYHILTYDYRGHYQSSGIENIHNITFSRIAKDLKQITDKLELDSYTLIGHSMGVNVCLEFAKLFPEKILKMILISGTLIPVHNIMMDSHITGPIKPYLTKILDYFPREFQAFWKYGGWSPVIKKMVQMGGFNPEQTGLDFVETYLSKLGHLGPELFFQLLNQMHEHDILAFIDRINIPTLVVGGNRDKVIPNFSQRLLHENLKGSELYIIHKGSHVPQVDFPNLINERMSYFIS